MKFFILFVCVLLLASCSSKSDLSSSQPRYLTPTQGVPTPSVPPPGSDDPQFREGMAAGEASYFVASGLAHTVRKNRSEEHSITGLVVCQESPREALVLPCGRINILLKDVAGHVVSSGTLEGGEFAFQVPGHVKYRVETQSKRFHQMEEKRLLKAGDDLVLHLYEKKS